MIELINNGVTTLNGAINSSVTSIVVTSGAVFPTTGDFYVLIDTEIIKVTARATNTLTVVRAQEGTVAASHLNAATIACIATAQTLRQLVANYVRTGAQAARGSNHSDGMIFLPNDGLSLSRDSGSTWERFGPIQKLLPPLLTDYTTHNANNTVITDDGSGVYMTRFGINSGLFEHTSILRSLPGSPFKLTCGLSTLGNALAFWEAGICLRQSSSDKRIAFGICETGRGALSKWTNKNTYSAHYRTRDLVVPMQCFFQIEEIAGVLKFRVSPDGFAWAQVYSISITDFMTSMDQFGLYCYCTHIADYAMAARFFHVKEG